MTAKGEQPGAMFESGETLVSVELDESIEGTPRIEEIKEEASSRSQEKESN